MSENGSGLRAAVSLNRGPDGKALGSDLSEKRLQGVGDFINSHLVFITEIVTAPFPAPQSPCPARRYHLAAQAIDRTEACLDPAESGAQGGSCFERLAP